jgi:hypothetical protein
MEIRMHPQQEERTPISRLDVQLRELLARFASGCSLTVITLTNTLWDHKRRHIKDAASFRVKPLLDKNEKLTGIACTLGEVADNLSGTEYIDALNAGHDRINSIEVDRRRQLIVPAIRFDRSQVIRSIGYLRRFM